MSHVSAPPQNHQRLRVLDSDLPFLASEAAIDIDNLLSDRAKDFTAMRRLAELLNNSLDIESSAPRSLMDPATLIVVGGAVAEAIATQSLKKIEDLLHGAVKIAKSLSSEDPTASPSELEQARDFCLALARAAVTYRKSINDLRPAHPLRR